jgi:hypothetical protein
MSVETVENIKLRQQLALKSLNTKWTIPQKTNTHLLLSPCPFCGDHLSTDREKCLCPPELCDGCGNPLMDGQSLFSKWDGYGDKISELQLKDLTSTDFRAARRILQKAARSQT